MRVLIMLAALIAVLALPRPGAAQDFIGFDRASFGRVVLNRTEAAGGSDYTLELAVGDYNNESITNYSDESIFARMGLSVGRLDILTDKGVFPCTAFIVDEKHILTNHHCVPGILENERAGATRIDSVLFVAGYTRQGVEEGTQRYTVIPTPVESSRELDYSVLEVIGNPSEKYGMLQLEARLPNDGDPYWVIGHPMGEAQRISREKCRANRPAVSNMRLLHTCDTLPGNSGSPVIDASTQMVIGLHHAGSNRDAVNFAIPMGAILEQSQVLKAAAAPAPPGGTGFPQTGGETPEPPRGQGEAAICDSLYDEAKAFGQCFAYEAYLEACENHPYAVMARAYVAQECSGGGGGGVSPPPGNTETQTTEILRPWCTGNRLNTTEATICGDRYLAQLDAELERAYESPARRVTSAQQNIWRIGTRDRCGSDRDCIASATIERIGWLSTAAPAPPSTGGGTSGGGTGTVRGNFQLSGSCYVMVASRPTVGEARSFISQWFGAGQGVRIFRSTNGYYGIALKTVSRDSSDWELSRLKSQGAIPSDSYCSSGERFVEEVLWNGGGSSSGGGSTSGGTMYIDGTSSLNVRTGPGTQYARITAIDRGTAVTVLGSRDGWANIRAGGVTGWVSEKFLAAVKPAAQRCTATVVNLNPYSSRTRSDGSGYLNIRTSGSTRAQIISETYLGDRVEVLARSGNWAQVRCISGQCLSPYRGTGGVTGWASAKYLSIRCD